MLWESKVSFKHSEVLSYQSANGNIADCLPLEVGAASGFNPGAGTSEQIRNAPAADDGETQQAPSLAE
jgi:hypothetical protein